MAKPTDKVPDNPDVRAERSDADVGAIVKGALYLGAAIVVSATLTVIAATYLSDYLGKAKKSDLEKAKAEYELPPEPRLEALEDLRERDRKNVVIYPPRAAEYYAKQKAELEKSKPERPEKADGLFPARKDGGKGPTNYGVRLPSKGSAGLTTTGGQ